MIVSVVVPTRNRLPFVLRAVACALGQEGVEVEVIVIDDGSTDDTSAQLQALSHPGLRVLTNVAPRGVAAARNAGIEAARGEWVAFLDDDDVWSPQKLSRQMQVVRRAHARVVYAGAVAIDHQGNVLKHLPFPDPLDVREQLRRSNVIPAGASNVLARRELLINAGGADESLVHLADWDLWLRLASRAPFAATPEVLVGYTLHSASASASLGRSLTWELLRLRRLHARDPTLRALDIDWAAMLAWRGEAMAEGGRRLHAVPALLAAFCAAPARGRLLQAASLVRHGAVRVAPSPAFDAPWLSGPFDICSPAPRDSREIRD